MHDSRGAQLKVGDRVLIEAEITELQPEADPDFCNVRVKAITPDQKDPTPMVPPSGMVFNTKMLTKIGAALMLAVLFLFSGTARADWASKSDGSWVFKADAKSAACKCGGSLCEECGPSCDCPKNRPASVAQASVYISVNLGGGRSAGGTGTVIASEDGRSLVLTNAHVVESAAHPITVTYWCDGKPWTQPATYLGGSAVSTVSADTISVHGPDLALISIAADLPAVEVAESIPAEGEAVSLFGFGGTGSTVYPKHKSGRVLREDGGRTTAGDPITRTSIATVNGDSGSGIFNDRGQLVAVHWGRGLRATDPTSAERLDTVHAFTVQVLHRKGLFARFKDRLAAKRIARAMNNTLSAIPVPSFLKPAAPAAVPFSTSPCPGGSCPAPSVRRRR